MKVLLMNAACMAGGALAVIVLCAFGIRWWMAMVLIVIGVTAWEVPVYLEWKKGKTESDWHDLVAASAEEHLIAVRHEPPPAWRADRVAGERAIALAIRQEHPTRPGQIRAWVERTGRSGRAYYRRLGGEPG